jgi:hypothetical protein
VEKKQMKVPIYPNVPATGKTDTSVEAALSVDHKTWMNRVLSAVREKPSTMSEVALAYGVYPTTTRPRATQLTALGFIRDSGQRRKNQFGRNETVYEACPEQTSLF